VPIQDITITPIPQQNTGAGFTVRGTFQFVADNGVANLQMIDDAGTPRAANPTVVYKPATFSFTHPAPKAVGSHSITVRAVGSTSVVTNKFTVVPVTK
jgi:hypothetical protein